MTYTTKQKKLIKSHFYEAGKDIIKGFTRGKSFNDIMNKQMKKEKVELKSQGIELDEKAILTGIAWGLTQMLKDSSSLPSYLKESDENETIERLIRVNL